MKKAQLRKSRFEIILLIFIGIKGVIMETWVPDGWSNNEPTLLQEKGSWNLLERERIRRKKPQLWENGFLLHQDNMPTHRALSEADFSSEHRNTSHHWTTLPFCLIHHHAGFLFSLKSRTSFWVCSRSEEHHNNKLNYKWMEMMSNWKPWQIPRRRRKIKYFRTCNYRTIPRAITATSSNLYMGSVFVDKAKVNTIFSHIGSEMSGPQY